MTERLHFHFSLSCIGEGNGNPLQCSCLENPRDGGAWWAALYGVAQSRTWLKQLSSSRSSLLRFKNKNKTKQKKMQFHLKINSWFQFKINNLYLIYIQIPRWNFTKFLSNIETFQRISDHICIGVFGAKVLLLALSCLSYSSWFAYTMAHPYKYF